ncbi:MAG: septum formation initiator family protein [Butyrivibrio sp.]
MRTIKGTGRRKSSNMLVGFAIVVVVIALAVIFNVRGRTIKAQNKADSDRIEELQREIESEQARAEELEEYSKYTNTKQFVEDMARKKLGLIYPDELIFKPED